jgi:hypothetical protein
MKNYSYFPLHITLLFVVLFLDTHFTWSVEIHLMYQAVLEKHSAVMGEEADVIDTSQKRYKDTALLMQAKSI